MHTHESHIPALDGVRGLAIALVFARHLSLLGWMRTSPSEVDRAVVGASAVGWVGVDLFFVLSGFLITGILLRERTRAAPLIAKFGRFYWRRVLRIMPLYYVVCAILFFVVPLLPYFRVQPEIAVLRQSEVWYWAYGVNFLEVLRGGVSTPFNTGHFWSLAVEEQFYLVWPFVVLGTSRKTLGRIVAGLLVVGPVVRLACIALLKPGVGETAAYTLSISRVDVLGVGAMVALIYQGDRERWARVRAASPWIGATALILFTAIAIFAGDGGSQDPTMQVVGYSVVALGMGSLIVCTLGTDGEPGWGSRFFCSRWLRTLGKYSYCLYIVHYPLMGIMGLVGAHISIVTFGGSRLPMWGAYGVILVIASFTIAMLSWRFLESPMLTLKSRFAFGMNALTDRERTHGN